MINQCRILKKYSFLLSQLVERDFKTKYKRSALGVLWSLLNPLLTMVVQYIVFSNLFKFNVVNYPIYLLTGTVIFNFMVEATTQSLTSITGNSSLITKVYVPKYIFPVSKVISSCVNLGFALIALFIITFIQGLRPNIYYLMIPFVLICLFLFSIGLSLILASLMVYFRDTQFLYSLLITLWTYLTPLFYPESILPEKYSFIFKLNPMHHFVRYIRAIILEGKLLDFRAHLFCLIFALISLIIGIKVFKKSQNNFVLNI